jgi:hypothetical protein
MERLKILAGGNSKQAQAQARGKLFERLMSDVLRHYGYSIDRTPNVNYAGMEIDIEGRALATNIPLYAECKCYETEIDSPKFQAFYGKYMARWRKDKRCQGLFIALPGVNSHVKAFYRETCEADYEATIRYYEEDKVCEAIYATKLAVRPEVVSNKIEESYGKPGDLLLLYTDKGLFWVQYVIPKGSAIPSALRLFDGEANPITDRTSIDYLLQLNPEFKDFDILQANSRAAQTFGILHQDTEQIVEVRGSSACFEYQFPSSPEFFVGRHSVLSDFDAYVNGVLRKETSARGILFEANSGWGKSSVVLASVERLEKMGHFAVAIDSRSASSSQFILRVVDFTLEKFQDFKGLVTSSEVAQSITGFEGAVNAVVALGKHLEEHNKLLFIFLDQFENLFFLQPALKRIRDLFLKICDSQTNIVLGFSWKTDLVGHTTDFPYELRDAITGSSKRISLNKFSEVETTALLSKLSQEIKARLRKDLQFFLSEFSQGYPWLLKKLCAHVKSQRQAGVQQLEIANSLLNIEELFQEDLRGLQPEEEDALRRIAKVAPISVQELGEEFSPQIIQSLVHARLIVSIGNKYDVYWDIFRDYLNTGLVPVQEHYILRVPPSSVLRAAKLLAESGGKLPASTFRQKTSLTLHSSYNLYRDMRLIGLIKIKQDEISLEAQLPKEPKAFEESARELLRERVLRNRFVWQILQRLKTDDSLSVDQAAEFLQSSSPYISATRETWRNYVRIFATWMDFTDLALFYSKEGIIVRFDASSGIRERTLSLAKREASTMLFPNIQYSPIEKMALRLYDAVEKGEGINWEGFKRSTRTKVLATLEDLEFIVIDRKQNVIRVRSPLIEFANEEKRGHVFGATALSHFPSFATFVKLLEKFKHQRLTHLSLGRALRDELGINWKDGTAKTNAKIMLDWARHTNYAPPVYSSSRKKASEDHTTRQDTLFSP